MGFKLVLTVTVSKPNFLPLAYATFLGNRCPIPLAGRRLGSPGLGLGLIRGSLHTHDRRPVLGDTCLTDKDYSAKLNIRRH